jgi:DNA-binding Lrp family transcriptional regulator
MDTLTEYLEHKDTFTVDDMFRFYSKDALPISRRTVNWRIHNFARKGIIKRVGRGLYRLGQSNLFQLEVSPKMKKIARFLKKEYPYTDFCVWELSVINQFSHYLINFNILFVDVERDAIDAVYHKLKEKNTSVFNIRKTDEDLAELANSICVRPLISHSPLQTIDEVPVASLEKILVDLYTDKEFFPFQGNDIDSIYESAFERYTINENTMLRYASRKEKKTKLQELLETIKRQ